MSRLDWLGALSLSKRLWAEWLVPPPPFDLALRANFGSATGMSPLLGSQPLPLGTEMNHTHLDPQMAMLLFVCGSKKDEQQERD